MSRITTHILDIALGRPAVGVAVVLERLSGGREAPAILGRGVTDDDGRLRDLVPPTPVLDAGVYRLIFDTGTYFREQELEAFYPEVSVIFEVRDGRAQYHVPLLLSPYGYSTYCGS